MNVNEFEQVADCSTVELIEVIIARDTNGFDFVDRQQMLELIYRYNDSIDADGLHRSPIEVKP